MVFTEILYFPYNSPTVPIDALSSILDTLLAQPEVGQLHMACHSERGVISSCLREFVYELTSSWPPAREEGRVVAASLRRFRGIRGIRGITGVFQKSSRMQ